MSERLQAVILGIIEGLTEFLPVSSTGHMVIAMPWLGVEDKSPPWPTFLYFIQIGAIVAVFVYFRRQLWRQARALTGGAVGSHVFVKVLVAMVPGAVVGLALNDVMEAHLEFPRPVAIALLLGAALMVVIERRVPKRPRIDIERVTFSQAVAIGLAQCVAVVPGTSRAMATIMGGMAVGLPAATAAEFSFYLAIPTLCGAGGLRLVSHWNELTPDMAGTLAVGFVVSFAVAWAVVAAFMRYIQTRPLWPFAIYRAVLAAAVLAWGIG